MACYQTCVDIGNRCKFVPRYKSCGGCGTFCVCTVQKPISTCCCCRTRVYCNPCSTAGILTSAQKTPPQVTGSSSAKSREYRESKSPVSKDFATPKESEVLSPLKEPSNDESPQPKVLSWLDWILSWFGIYRRNCKCKTYSDKGGAAQGLSDENKETEGDKEKPQDKKLGPRSASFCKESSQTSLAKARDICSKVKQLYEADTKRIEENCKNKSLKSEEDVRAAVKKGDGPEHKQKGKSEKPLIQSTSPVLARGRKKRRSPSLQRDRSTSRSKRSESSSRDPTKRNRSLSRTSRSPSFNSTGKQSRNRSRSRSCGRYRRSSQSPDISPPKLIKSASMTNPCSSFMCRNFCSRPCFPSCYVPRRPLSASCCSSELCEPCTSCRPRAKSPKSGSSSARRSRSCPRPCPCPCLACDPTDPCPPISYLPCCKPVCKPCPPSCLLPCCKPICPPPSRCKPRYRPGPPLGQKNCCKQCSMPVSCSPCGPCPPTCCKPCCKPLCPPECCKPCCATLKSCPPSCVRSCCLPCPRRGPSVYCGPPCMRPCPPPVRRKYPTPACFTSTGCSLFPRPCSCPPSPVCPLSSSCGTTMTSLCKSRSNDARCRMLLSKYGTRFPSVGLGGGYKASIPGNSSSPASKAGIEPCENYTHSRRPASPSDMESRDISFNTSPCCKKSRIEFNLAKQHPYIRQMGPRSPCEEFMASLKLKFKKNEKCGDKAEKNTKHECEVGTSEHVSNALSTDGTTRHSKAGEFSTSERVSNALSAHGTSRHSKAERGRSSTKQRAKSLSKEISVAEKDTEDEIETHANKSENNALSQMRLRYQFNQSACDKKIRCSFGPCSTCPEQPVRKGSFTSHQKGEEQKHHKTSRKNVKSCPLTDVTTSVANNGNTSTVPYAFKEIEEVLHSSSCCDMPTYNNYGYISVLNKFQEKMHPSQRTELIVESIRQTLRMNKYLHKSSAQSTDRILKSVEDMCAAAERTFEKYKKEKIAKNGQGSAHESSDLCKDKGKTSREKAQPKTSETPSPKSDSLKENDTLPSQSSGHSIPKHVKGAEDKSANRSMEVESVIFNPVCMQENPYVERERNCMRKSVITENPVGFLNELELSLSAGETKKEFPQSSSTMLCSDSFSLFSSDPTFVPSTTANSVLSHYCQDELDIVTVRMDCCESRKVYIPDSDTTLVQERSAGTLLDLKSAISQIRDGQEFKADSSLDSLANQTHEVSEAESSGEGESISNVLQSEMGVESGQDHVPTITIEDLLGRSQLQWQRMGRESDSGPVRDAKLSFDCRRSLVTPGKKDVRPISRIIRSFGVSPTTTEVSQSVSQLKAFIQQNGTPV